LQRLRFGIIGVGNIAPVHAAAIRGTPDAELVAVATRNPDRGRAFANQNGGTWYSDYRALLAQPDIDVVTLCTPHDLHLPMTLDATAAGKHVLCEKPMARTVAECDTMIQAARRAGVGLGVILQARFEPLAARLKAALDRGVLGRAPMRCGIGRKSTTGVEPGGELGNMKGVAPSSIKPSTRLTCSNGRPVCPGG
jgi:UDP-N-acetyl-2-amino-2-deoxyglucuronate dehydrogenase